MYVIRDRFGAQDSDARDFVDALGAGAFAANQFKRDAKCLTIWPDNFENLRIPEGSKRLRWKFNCHKASFRF